VDSCKLNKKTKKPQGRKFEGKKVEDRSLANTDASPITENPIISTTIFYGDEELLTANNTDPSESGKIIQRGLVGVESQFPSVTPSILSLKSDQSSTENSGEKTTTLKPHQLLRKEFGSNERHKNFNRSEDELSPDNVPKNEAYRIQDEILFKPPQRETKLGYSNSNENKKNEENKLNLTTTEKYGKKSAKLGPLFANSNVSSSKVSSEEAKTSDESSESPWTFFWEDGRINDGQNALVTVHDTRKETKNVNDSVQFQLTTKIETSITRLPELRTTEMKNELSSHNKFVSKKHQFLKATAVVSPITSATKIIPITTSVPSITSISRAMNTQAVTVSHTGAQTKVFVAVNKSETVKSFTNGKTQFSMPQSLPQELKTGVKVDKISSYNSITSGEQKISKATTTVSSNVIAHRTKITKITASVPSNARVIKTKNIQTATMSHTGEQTEKHSAANKAETVKSFGAAKILISAISSPEQKTTVREKKLAPLHGSFSSKGQKMSKETTTVPQKTTIPRTKIIPTSGTGVLAISYNEPNTAKTYETAQLWVTTKIQIAKTASSDWKITAKKDNSLIIMKTTTILSQTSGVRDKNMQTTTESLTGARTKAISAVSKAKDTVQSLTTKKIKILKTSSIIIKTTATEGKLSIHNSVTLRSKKMSEVTTLVPQTTLPKTKITQTTVSFSLMNNPTVQPLPQTNIQTAVVSRNRSQTKAYGAANEAKDCVTSLASGKIQISVTPSLALKKTEKKVSITIRNNQVLKATSVSLQVSNSRSKIIKTPASQTAVHSTTNSAQNSVQSLALSNIQTIIPLYDLKFTEKKEKIVPYNSITSRAPKILKATTNVQLTTRLSKIISTTTVVPPSEYQTFKAYGAASNALLYSDAARIQVSIVPTPEVKKTKEKEKNASIQNSVTLKKQRTFKSTIITKTTSIQWKEIMQTTVSLNEAQTKSYSAVNKAKDIVQSLTNKIKISTPESKTTVKDKLSSHNSIKLTEPKILKRTTTAAQVTIMPTTKIILTATLSSTGALAKSYKAEAEIDETVPLSVTPKVQRSKTLSKTAAMEGKLSFYDSVTLKEQKNSKESTTVPPNTGMRKTNTIRTSIISHTTPMVVSVSSNANNAPIRNQQKRVTDPNRIIHFTKKPVANEIFSRTTNIARTLTPQVSQTCRFETRIITFLMTDDYKVSKTDNTSSKSKLLSDTAQFSKDSKLFITNSYFPIKTRKKLDTDRGETGIDAVAKLQNVITSPFPNEKNIKTLHTKVPLTEAKQLSEDGESFGPVMGRMFLGENNAYKESESSEDLLADSKGRADLYKNEIDSIAEPPTQNKYTISPADEVTTPNPEDVYSDSASTEDVKALAKLRLHERIANGSIPGVNNTTELSDSEELTLLKKFIYVEKKSNDQNATTSNPNHLATERTKTTDPNNYDWNEELDESDKSTEQVAAIAHAHQKARKLTTMKPRQLVITELGYYESDENTGKLKNKSESLTNTSKPSQLVLTELGYYESDENSSNTKTKSNPIANETHIGQSTNVKPSVLLLTELGYFDSNENPEKLMKNSNPASTGVQTPKFITAKPSQLLRKEFGYYESDERVEQSTQKSSFTEIEKATTKKPSQLLRTEFGYYESDENPIDPGKKTNPNDVKNQVIDAASTTKKPSQLLRTEFGFYESDENANNPTKKSNTNEIQNQVVDGATTKKPLQLLRTEFGYYESDENHSKSSKISDSNPDISSEKYDHLKSSPTTTVKPTQVLRIEFGYYESGEKSGNQEMQIVNSSLTNFLKNDKEFLNTTIGFSTVSTDIKSVKDKGTTETSIKLDEQLNYYESQTTEKSADTKAMGSNEESEYDKDANDGNEDSHEGVDHVDNDPKKSKKRVNFVWYMQEF